jgi:hypothetical protein
MLGLFGKPPGGVWWVAIVRWSDVAGMAKNHWFLHRMEKGEIYKVCLRLYWKKRREKTGHTVVIQRCNDTPAAYLLGFEWPEQADGGPARSYWACMLQEDDMVDLFRIKREEIGLALGEKRYARIVLSPLGPLEA